MCHAIGRGEARQQCACTQWNLIVCSLGRHTHSILVYGISKFTKVNECLCHAIGRGLDSRLGWIRG